MKACRCAVNRSYGDDLRWRWCVSLRARARLTESMGGKLLNEVSSMVGVARVVLFSFCVHMLVRVRVRVRVRACVCACVRVCVRALNAVTVNSTKGGKLATHIATHDRVTSLRNTV